MSRLTNILTFGVLKSFFIIISLMCGVPPISRDALTHHLAVPKLYVEHGTIYELPDIIPSYYPQLLDLIYCLPLGFNNDIFPKYIHFAFAIMTAFLVFKSIRKLGELQAIISSLFFLSLPIITKLSTQVYVDLGLIFFSFGSLYFILKWHEKNYRYPYIVISAVLCGLALSTKYNGLITLFILTCFIPFIFLNQNQKNSLNQIKATGYGILFLLISLIIFSPWMIKNYAWTKNPVYPLYNNIFNKADSNNENEKNWSHFLTRKHVHKEKWWETLSIPIRIFFQGEDDNPKFFDGRLNPFLLILPFLAFINLPQRGSPKEIFQLKILLSFSILYIFLVFLRTDMRIRWMAPAIPPLVILSAYGVHNLWIKSLRKYQKMAIALFVFFALALNFIYLSNLFKKIDPIPYITNQITRDEYIQKKLPEYNPIQFANKSLNPSSKLLVFFLGDRRYYFKHNVSFNSELFKKIVLDSNTPLEITSMLKKHGFTHLFINYQHFFSWMKREFTEQQIQLINKILTDYSGQLYSRNGFKLYHLKG